MDARPATALFRLPSLAPRSAAPPRVLLWWGITLICIGVLGFCFILYATLLSKLLPPSGVPILDAIRSDWEGCAGTIVLLCRLQDQLSSLQYTSIG
ncbi:hypothetical protein CY35_13G027900 [Sphagnum magellanicum]|nr:hypothetical protein CY35_13G027900 [Sphagnum magellanicum]